MGYQAAEIGTLSGSGAFKGKAAYFWKGQENKILIHVAKWEIRYRCHGKEGATLGKASFRVGNIKGKKYWGTDMNSETIEINQYISRGQNLVLHDLCFEIELNGKDKIEDIFLVATLESGKERVGYNFDISEHYLISNRKIVWP